MRCALISCLLGLATSASAQIVTDGSVGEAVELLPGAAGEIEIPEQLGQRGGSNLLHSFDRFGIGPGQTASFTSEGPGIDRVLARVTGPESTRIDGLLRSTVPGADLFLFNPQGIVFGPDGALDVPGDFHASTADALHLEDGTILGTDPDAPVTLSWAAPAAWGFDDAPAAGIDVDGAELAVGEERTLSLVGGELSIRGRPGDLYGEPVLVAPGGSVELASAASAGRVALTPDGPETDSFALLGPISISDNAQISTAGERSGSFRARADSLLLERAFVFSDSLGAGAPLLLAIDVDVRDLLQLRGPAELTAELLGQGDTGDIELRAGEVHLAGEGALVNSWVSSGSGAGGDVSLEAGRIALEDGAQVIAQTNAAGAGGAIRVDAERLEMRGRETSLATETSGGGSAGDLDVCVDALEITELAQLGSRTLGSGHGGDVRVKAGSIRIEDIEIGEDEESSRPSGIFSQEDPDPNFLERPGDRGLLHVSAETIELRDGGQILSRSFAENSANGDVAAPLIVEAGSVTLVGGTAPSGIRSRTLDRDGGRLELTANRLELRDGGVISASTRGRGRGGDVAIRAASIRVDGIASDADVTRSGIFSQALSRSNDAGDGGSIAIATRDLVVSDGGRISVASFGPGDGGELIINAPHADPYVEAWAAQARVEVSAADIRSSATTGAGAARRGGDIEIHARTLRLGPGGELTALNEVSGDAGSIALTLGERLELDGGEISTEARNGLGGNVTIRATELVQLRKSAIATNVDMGGGDAGAIDIDPDLVVLDRSTITTTADAGDGGDIRIVAGRLLVSGDCAGASCVDASSNTGIDGEISLSSPVEDLSESTRAADPRFGDASDRLDRGCAARRSRAGSLTVGARVIRVGPGGVISEPDVGATPGTAASGEACRAP